MRRVSFVAIAAVLTLVVGVAAEQARPASAPRPLTIYIADVEGGAAKLFIAPSGESVLVDSGNPGERDLNRILDMLRDANVTKLDYMLTTHYHVDHVGALVELAKRMPIGTYVDHGPTVEGPVNPALREQVPGFQAAYAELYSKAKHLVVKPGDRLPIAGLDWRIVMSAGQAIKTPLAGGGIANPACATFERRQLNFDPENSQSVGSVIAHGRFRTIELGDLLWNEEFDLMCPTNKVGTIDLYLASHHGTDPSGSPALVHGLRPRVAIQENGVRKGGTAQTYLTLESSPGFEDMWQLHWSYNGLIEHNAPGLFIANVEDAATTATILTTPPRAGGAGGRQGAGGAGRAAGAAATPGAAAPAAAPPTAAPAATPVPAAPAAAAAPAGAPAAPAQAGAPGAARGGGGTPPHTPAYWIKVVAQADGTFTVSNSRNGFSKTYVKR